MDGAKRVLLVLAAVLMLGPGCGDGTSGGVEGEPAAAPEDCPSAETVTSSGLRYADIECGTGDEAAKGDIVEVHYVGTLDNGKKFDSSRDRGQTFKFQLGAGQVIAGWDDGLVGMKVGGVRELTIPPELGHGKAGFPPTIPPNATLIFEVELISIS